MQELSAEQAQKQSLLLPISQVSFQQLFPTTVLCPRLVASWLPPDANLHGDGAYCGTEGSMHSGSHYQNQQRMPGTAKAAKSMIARQSWTPIAIP